jgi:hypothetical protein
MSSLHLKFYTWLLQLTLKVEILHFNEKKLFLPYISQIKIFFKKNQWDSKLILFPLSLIGYIFAIVMSLQGGEGQKMRQVAYVMGSGSLMGPTLRGGTGGYQGVHCSCASHLIPPG